MNFRQQLSVPLLSDIQRNLDVDDEPRPFPPPTQSGVLTTNLGQQVTSALKIKHANQPGQRFFNSEDL